MKKYLCVFLVLGMVFTMVGCTQPNSAASTSTTSTTASASNPIASSTPAAPAVKTMRVTYMQSGTYDVAAKSIIDKFKEKTGVDVEVVTFPWDVLRQNNTTDILSGTNQYSVMSGGNYLSDVFRNMTPLTSYIKENGFGEGFISGLQGKTCMYEGDPIGAQYGLDAYGMVYRKDLFEQYNIKLPTTWAEFNHMLAELKEKLPSDITPYVFAGGATEQVGNLFLARYNGYYITKDNKYHLEADKAAAVIKDIAKSYSYGSSNITALSIDQANAVFLQGKAAIMECWPSLVTAALIDPQKSSVIGKWGIAPYPTDGGGSYLSCWNMFIPAKCEDPDLAWKWINEYSSKENAKKFFLEHGIGPCYADLYTDPDVIEKYGEGAFDGHLKNVANAVDYPLNGEAQDILCAIIGDVLSGKISAEEAVSQINTNFSNLTVTKEIMLLAVRDGFVEK